MEMGTARGSISTARREIEDEFRAGNFNAELYFRLNGVCVRVPALREHKEDLPELVDHFLDKYGDLFERRRPKISEDCMQPIGRIFVAWERPPA